MRLFRNLWKFSLFFICLCFIFAICCYFYVKLTPTVNINSSEGITYFDNTNTVFYQGNGTSTWANLEDISQSVIDATISSEDKNFYSHHGFDFKRIVKAMFTNITSGTKQGASTISQQYVKNLYLDFDQTWARKWDEMWLTMEIETHYSKDEILEGYLNTINYGHGMYGIEKASKFYFNKSAKDLTLAEASILVGIPKSPTNYSPVNDFDAAKERQKYILSTMVENKYITQSEADNAYNEELTIVGSLENDETLNYMYYISAVNNELEELGISKSLVESGGLKIYTSMDVKAQNALENNTKNVIDEKTEIQTSSMMMDPNTGAIIALVGGRDYNTSEYNRAISSKRQIGSTMKPFLYYAALENGFTASSAFKSEQTTFTLSNNETYSPKNYNDKYAEKPISLATAIAYSDNIYAVKTHMFLGEDMLVETAKRVGITSKLEPVASLPLGTYEMYLKELVGGYSAFANGGYKIKPYLIKKVENAKGEVLYEVEEEKEQVLSESITFILSNLLTSTYDSAFIDYNYPTAISLAPKMTHTYALKSGTTDTDSIYIGYTPDVVTAVWCGYDDNRDIEADDYKYTKDIWINAMEDYLEGTENHWYEIPDNVVGVLVDPITGKPASKDNEKAKIMYYIKGSEPSADDPVFDEIEPNNKE